MHETCAHWLLGFLIEDLLLPYYLKGALPATSLAHDLLRTLFWTLPATDLRPEEQRRNAWKLIDKWLSEATQPPQERIPTDKVFSRVWRELNYAYPRLLAKYGLTTKKCELTSSRDSKLLGLVETHVHFRGAVPFDDLWKLLLDDARLRARHRAARVESGTWSKTRAELLEDASQLALSFDDAVQAVEFNTDTDDQRVQAVSYLAIRGNFKRFLLVERGRIGLTSFTQAYDRYSGVIKRKSLPAVDQERDIKQVCAVLEKMEFRGEKMECRGEEMECRGEEMECRGEEMERRGVRGVELRPTFEPTRIQLQRKLRPLVLGYLMHLAKYPDSSLTFGLVPSLLKQDGLRQELNCSELSPGGWVRSLVERWRSQVEALLAVLDEVPALRLFVVGIDAAGREQGCPVRCLAPAYRLVHEYHRRFGLSTHTPGRRMDPWVPRLRELLRKKHNDPYKVWEVLNEEWAHRISRIRLGLTVHAGEDFVDPITGLREISDAIMHLDLQPGDRIGHGLAAGLDKDLLAKLLEHRARSSSYRFAEYLAKSVGDRRIRLRKPIGVHILDVAWTQHMGDSRDVAGNDDALFGVVARAYAIPHAAAEIRRELREEVPEPELRLPGLHFDKLEELPPECFTTIVVDSDYYSRFEYLRTKVLQQIQNRSIVIESCPTSNMTIASLERPPARTFLKEDLVHVTIASDDPAIFESWLDEEVHLASPEDSERIRAEMEAASFI